MDIGLSSNDGVTTFAFSGALDDRVLPEVETNVRQRLHDGPRLVFDMSGVDSLTQAGIRWVRLLYREAVAAGGSVRVVGLSPANLAALDAVGYLGLSRPTPLELLSPPVAAESLNNQRVDLAPTLNFGGYALRPGRVFPFGAWKVPGGVSFSVSSQYATGCTLVLFERGAKAPLVEIPFPSEFRVGRVFAMTVLGLDPDRIEYGYRMDGPFDPQHGQRFDATKILLDPFARALGGCGEWGVPPEPNDPFPRRSELPDEDFEWDGDRPLALPADETVIYELHVRGFTQSPSSGVTFPGTYAGLREKIPYLKELGINCVELMPVFEFDELENTCINPQTGERLVNYWGYSTLGFYAPKAAYAATGKFGLHVDEFKTLVKELHRSGIEVVLDVVFNHTAEGNENGPTLSFRGIDNRTYYMLAPDGSYYNFSGCGNTFNCNNPTVRNFVLDCLRTWVTEFHIDGFRFDLATILGRDALGTPLSNPPLVESLALDPVLAQTKLIAEAWDAGGLYQVGAFPNYGRWAEWNGQFRDTVRKFLKGDLAQVGGMVQRLVGSPSLYRGRGATASINFVTCHDGFTLADLVSYNAKHNEANGENNRDGSNDNDSWNCGVEGPTDDAAILALRRRQMKNALTMLFVSQGVPMLLMGDEFGRTQQGNNNAYCHDGPLSWVDWTLLKMNLDLFQFCQRLIGLRRAHPALRFSQHAGDLAPDGSFLEVTWHGLAPWNADWSPGSRTLACILRRYGGAAADDIVYIALNMWWESLDFTPPPPQGDRRWHMAVNTALEPPQDAWAAGEERLVDDATRITVAGRSAIVLVAR